MSNFEEYNLSEEYKKFEDLTNKLIDNRKTVMVLKDALDKIEENAYTEISMSVGTDGKLVYKNAESRQIAVHDTMRNSPIYNDYQKQKQLSIELELNYEKQKKLLDLLMQEKQFKMEMKL